MRQKQWRFFMGTFLVLFCWKSPLAEAFFVHEAIELSEKMISLEARGEYLRVEIAQVFQNKSERPQLLTLYEPLGSSTEEVTFFVQAEKTPFEVFSGQSRLNKIFDQAREEQDPRFFRLASRPFTKLFVASDRAIAAGGTLRTKLSFLTRFDFVAGVFFTEFFGHDTGDIGHFSFSVKLEAPHKLHHFFTNLPPGARQDRSAQSVTYLFSQRNFRSLENIRLFWSELLSPLMHFPTQQGVYQGQFAPLTGKKQHQEVTILIDRSGSMLGSLWDRSEDFLHYLLDRLGDQARVRLVFFDEQAAFFPEGKKSFEPNTFAFRKDFFHFWDRLKPLGKTDIKTAFQAVQDGWTQNYEDRLLVVLGDVSARLDLSEIPSPMVLLHFSDDPGNLDLLARASGGFSLKLFRTPLTLLEENAFSRWWDGWRKPSHRNDIRPPESVKEILPEQFNFTFFHQPALFIGRQETSSTPLFGWAFRFLPRLWAAHRITEIMNQLIEAEQLAVEKLDAVLALGRTFGIRTSFFDDRTTRRELENRLGQEDIDTWWKEKERLEQGVSATGTAMGFMGHVPLYFQKNESVWRAYNFHERVEPDLLLRVAPFSQAQKEIFLKHSQEVAEAFGAGLLVDFCLPYRCISVSQTGGQTPRLKDQLFWKTSPPKDHWAYGSIMTLVEAGVWPLVGDGFMPDKPIARGEFVKILYDRKKERQMGSVQKKLEGRFVDVEKESPYAQAIEFFAQQGIVSGYRTADPEKKAFWPNNPITRAEAVKLLLAVDGIAPKNVKPLEAPVFADSLGWERGWVERASQMGMVRGYEAKKGDDGETTKTFRPHTHLTRGEAAKLLTFH